MNKTIKYYIRNQERKIVYKNENYSQVLQVYQEYAKNGNHYYITSNWKIK